MVCFCFRNYDDSSLEELGYHVDESTDQNNNITMTSEDLLQPGHVVKERWKVVSFLSEAFLLNYPSRSNFNVLGKELQLLERYKRATIIKIWRRVLE